MTIWRKSFGWVLLIVGVICAVFVFLRTSTNRAETIVQGKPLSAWVRDLGNPNFDATNRTYAREVLAKQSPTIIPELLNLKPLLPPLEKLFAKFRRITGMPGAQFDSNIARSETFSVITAIVLKNNLASERRPEFRACVDELLRQLKSDPANARGYYWVIGCFGVNATNALPTLIAALPTNFSSTTFPQGILLRAIAEIDPGSYSQQVIPAATNLLSSVEPGNIDVALRVLGACGTNARPFIPQIVQCIEMREQNAGAAIRSLALIGQPPKELKATLAERMERGFGPAAVAMLQIDPKEPTALNIVQARLHPLAGGDHIEMIQLISRVPSVAKLFVPDLEKLAKKTNAPTSYLARQTLRQFAEETP